MRHNQPRMPASIFTDDAEERKVRHGIARLRPEGTRCCVPDYLEAQNSTFRLCAWKECGSRGRPSAIGVCRKPQRPTSHESCSELFAEFLSDEEQQAYEKAVKTEDTNDFTKTQVDFSKKIYREMRMKHLGHLTLSERENKVFDQLWLQIQMVGYRKAYRENFLKWLDKDV